MTVTQTLTERVTRTARPTAIFAATVLAVLVLVGFVTALFDSGPSVNLIDHVEYRIDPTAEATVDDISGMIFTPASPIHRGSYGQAAHWFRVHLDTTNLRDDVLLEVMPPVLDRVTLFLPAKDRQGWDEMSGGDRIADGQHIIRGASIGFEIPATRASRPLYLRIESSGSTALELRASTLPLAQQSAARLLSLHVFYFALLGMGLLLASLRLLQSPTTLSLSLFGFLVSYIILSLEGLGYAAVLFDDPLPGFHDTLTLFSAVTSVLLSMLFQRLYLRCHQPNRWAMRGADVVIIAQAAMFVPLAAGDVATAGLGTVSLSLIYLVLLAVMIATARFAEPAVRGILVFAYSAHILVAGLWLASRVGYVAFSGSTRHFIEIYGLNILLLAMLVIALDRTQRIRRERETQLVLAAAEAEQVAHRRNAELQEDMMHLLMHEVRNNLSVVQLSLPDLQVASRRDQLSDAIRGLTDALNQAQQKLWLAKGNRPASPEPVPVLEALDRVIDSLRAADRIRPQGDAAEAQVMADPTMLDALLLHALKALLPLGDKAHPVTVDVRQDRPGLPCILDLRVTSASRPTVAPDLTLAADLAARMNGRLHPVPTHADTYGASITLPP